MSGLDDRMESVSGRYEEYLVVLENPHLERACDWIFENC